MATIRYDEATATTCQLRYAIDGGLTGDKVRVFDPAAAPLGTDDEAAGIPPRAEDIARVLQQERLRRSGAGAPAPDKGHQAGPWLVSAVVLAVLALAVAIAWLG